MSFGFHFLHFPINIGFLSSSQLTKSYFSEGWPKTSNQVLTALSLFPDLTKGVGVELSHERQQEAVKKAHAASPQVRRRAEFLQGDICDESNQKIVEAISTARVLFVTCF